MAETNRSIDELVQVTGCIVRVSNALFGYVFELAPDAKTFLRGRPLPGTVSEERLLKEYYKPVGDYALELVGLCQDQATRVNPPDEVTADSRTWFTAVVTQDLGTPACIAILYPFYDQEEAVRTLRLIEMIMTKKKLV